MIGYLVQFTYDHYCQGYEDATISVLVYAHDYHAACKRITKQYKNARNFHNLTLGAPV